jgi:hypothetical protein
MRILLLRVLIASWGIPLAWVVFFPLFYLLSGFDVAIKDMRWFMGELWSGDQ